MQGRIIADREEGRVGGQEEGKEDVWDGKGEFGEVQTKDGEAL